jgi:DNA-binding MurR/RpiR family transcriptional regulator
MLVEDKTVHLVPEDSPSTAMLDTLTPDDLIIVVTTSNGFARRQRAVIERCRAYKVIVTASEDPALHAIFDDVLAFGKDAGEGSSLHRIYATFGVTYFFDRLFAQYARAFDPLL